MVTMGARVTLAELLAERDASIAHRPNPFALAGLRAKRTAWIAARKSASGVRTGMRALVLVTLFLAAFTSRHGLVLAGLAAFVTAAALYSPIAGLVTAGAGLFFLELRRR